MLKNLETCPSKAGPEKTCSSINIDTMFYSSINNITKFDVEIQTSAMPQMSRVYSTVDGDTHLLKQNITEWSLEEFSNIFPKELVSGKEFIFGGTVDDPFMNKNIVIHYKIYFR